MVEMITTSKLMKFLFISDWLKAAQGMETLALFTFLGAIAVVAIYAFVPDFEKDMRVLGAALALTGATGISSLKYLQLIHHRNNCTIQAQCLPVILWEDEFIQITKCSENISSNSIFEWNIKQMFDLKFKVFTPQPLRAVRVLSSPMVSGWVDGRAMGKSLSMLYLRNRKV